MTIIIIVIGILFILFSPISATVLDGLLLVNLSLALFILVLTFYVKKPVEFSTFPSVLLISTLFRLALNLSATRLILADAHAGQVIHAIGTYVVRGNYVIGVIVFLILVVVQYVVVTSGAQRVAEVAARFTLDSMPGQQMSIDADLNMGFIDQEQAQLRRKTLGKEAGFYGAMDGASKFVKGDAIASIIIMLINIIGGFIVGLTQKGMSWQDALQIYTLLTIGDGIVTQIPALVISVGTGIIITRSASDDRLSYEVFSQFMAYPNILLIVASTLFVLAVLPGFPALIALALGAGFLVIATLLYYYSRNRQEQDAGHGGTEQDESLPALLYEEMQVDALLIEVAPSLLPLTGSSGALLLERIDVFRRQFALSSGLIFPPVKIKENKALAENSYTLILQGGKIGEGSLLQDHWLAIHPTGAQDLLEGMPTRDPAYHLPAIWIADNLRTQARENGYTVVDTMTVLMTHFSELIKKNAASLLMRPEVERLVQHISSQQEPLIAELIPNILSLADIQKVLQALLREKVSIRYLAMIFEALVDIGRTIKDIDAVTERLRGQLGTIICEPLLDSEGFLHVISLDGTVEQTLYDGIRQVENGQASLSLEPGFSEKLLKSILSASEKMVGSNYAPTVLCASEIRISLRRLTERVIPNLHVLALSEVPTHISLKSFSTVSF